MTFDTETSAGFLRSRLDWLRVETVDRPEGGWDVVLRLDGTYSDSAEEHGLTTREASIAYFTDWLRSALINDGVITRTPDRNAA